MSDLFALSTRENQAASDPEAGLTSAEVPSGLFHGVPTGTAMGFGRAAGHLARAFELAGSVPVGFAGALAYGDPERWTDAYFHQFDPSISKAVDYFTPTPGQVGTVGNILGGVSETVSLLAAGGGNPAPLLAVAGLSGAADLSNEGVSPDVAAAGGALESAANAFGFKVPILGKSIASRLATGAFGNLAIGRGTTLAEQQLLARTGNTEQARNFNPWDLTGATVDALTGVAFGTVHHLANRPVRPSEQEAALTALNAKHFQSDTAPGEPADLEAFAAHQEAMAQATGQHLRDEPVTAADPVQRSLFEPRPELPPAQIPPELKALDAERQKAAAQSIDPLDAPNFGMPEVPKTLPDTHPLLVPQDTNASPERAAIRQQIVDAATADATPVEGRKPVAYVMGGGGASGKGTILDRLQRLGIIPKKGAVHIDPDHVKEQIPEYRQILGHGDGRAAAVVHEESSLLSKQILAKAIGKNADVILDRTMSDEAKAPAEIKALKDAGYEVRLYGVTVEPNSAVSRASSRAQRINRYVPPQALLKAHKGFAALFERLANMVDHAMLMDNQVPHGQAPRIVALRESGKSLQIMDRKRYNAFAERRNLNDQATTLRELAGGHKSGEPTPAGVDAGGVSSPGEVNAGGNATVDGRGGQPIREAPASGAVPGERVKPSPIVTAARVAAESLDIPIPTGEFNRDGSPVTMSAREILARGDAEIADAHQQAKAIEAVGACFLANGAG